MEHAQTDWLLVQRNVILGLLLALAAAAWTLLAWQGTGAEMDMAMGSPTMGMRAPLFLAIWVVMMVAMMFPTAAPMILTFHKVQVSKRQRGEAFVATWVFVAAYMLVWTLSGAAAYAGALAVEAIAARAALSPTTAARIGGAVLVAAGVYQITPFKNLCLSKCRTPISFIMTSWRDGVTGALRMGLLHGAYCLGCCWLLFVVLFPLGIMNVAAMAVITLVIFAEKVTALGPPCCPCYGRCSCGLWRRGAGRTARPAHLHGEWRHNYQRPRCCADGHAEHANARERNRAIQAVRGWGAGVWCANHEHGNDVAADSLPKPRIRGIGVFCNRAAYVRGASAAGRSAATGVIGQHCTQTIFLLLVAGFSGSSNSAMRRRNGGFPSHAAASSGQTG